MIQSFIQNLHLVSFCFILEGEKGMAVIDREKYFEKKADMLEFVCENRKIFGDYFPSLLSFVVSDLGLELQEYCPMVIKQIFSKFDLYLDGADEYQMIAQLLKRYSFLNGNLAEVGAGFYPRLAEIILPSIKGTLTLYEPNIHFTDFKAKIVKDPFTWDSDISDIDTLYALYPCEATIPVLEKAFYDDKNVLLAFCDCNHSTIRHRKRGDHYWAHYVCEDYLDQYGEEIEILKWPSTVQNLDLPILVRKSSKQLKKSI